MSGFLLDTHVTSELIKPRPDPRVADWVDSVEESSLYLSVLTLGEIRHGIAQLPRGRRRSQLESWLESSVRARFGGRLLPVDAPVADRWGQLAGAADARGHRMPVIEGLLAATALDRNLTLVTRDARDAAATGVPIFNPWEP